MKYITELDTDQTKKLASKLPNNSALVKLNDYIVAINVSSTLWSMSERAGSVELILAKDTEGRTSTLIDRSVVARKLYEIAEPGGSDWRFLTDAHRARYIRMQDAGVRPT